MDRNTGGIKTLGDRKVRRGEGILQIYNGERGEREGRDWEIKKRGRGIKGGRGVVKGRNQNQKTTLNLSLGWRIL